MSDRSPNNEVLDFLREQFARLNAKLDRVAERVDERGHRLIRIELAGASARRDQANDAESRAELDIRFDRLRKRVDRIERRLDIVVAT